MDTLWILYESCDVFNYLFRIERTGSSASVSTAIAGRGASGRRATVARARVQTAERTDLRCSLKRGNVPGRTPLRLCAANVRRVRVSITELASTRSTATNVSKAKKGNHFVSHDLLVRVEEDVSRVSSCGS